MVKAHFIIVICLLVSLQGVAQKKSTQTKVIAHRGAWKNTGFPQNSIASLEAAIKMGCFASECDVWMTSDSVLVINHDPLFYETSIEHVTYSELLKQKHPNGEPIPTLQEYLTVAGKQKKTRLVLDIKPSKISKERSLVLARKCYEMVQKMKLQKMIDYIFFDYDACLELRKLDAKANVAYLLSDKPPAEIADAKLWGIDYNFRVFDKNPTWVKEAQDKKLTINVWTVNEKSMMERFINEQVDFITTDEPELMLEITKAKSR